MYCGQNSDPETPEDTLLRVFTGPGAPRGARTLAPKTTAGPRAALRRRPALADVVARAGPTAPKQLPRNPNA